MKLSQSQCGVTLRLGSAFLLFAALTTFSGTWCLARVGDDWETRRGDSSPGLTYVDIIRTNSGRIIAVSDGGGLMISDDGGANWEFDRIEVNDIPAGEGFGTLFKDGGSIIAVQRMMEESPGLFRYAVQTTFYTSGDDGETWSKSDFPVEFVQRGVRRLYGINIIGLVEGPGGELLAYGTTTGSNNLFAYYAIGGLIFREGAGGWEQAFYGFGPIFDIATGGGRAIAAAHNGVLDSADGAGWNGYRLRDATVNNGGSPLDLDEQNRLRVRDVEIVGGTYIATAGTFVPYKGSAHIDSSTVDNLYNLNSLTPFGPGRNWDAYQQSMPHGKLIQTGSGLLGVGVGGIYQSGNDAQSFTLANPQVRVPFGMAVGTGGSNYLAVESSETVWQSTDNGANWTKIRDEPLAPNLRLLGAFSGSIYGVASRTSTIHDLWVSHDNGESWQVLYQDFDGFSSNMFQLPGGDLVVPKGSSSIKVSDDGGENWTDKVVGTAATASAIAQSPTGRLFIPAQGSGIFGNDGPVYYSDDGGDTWTARGAGILTGEKPRVTAVAQSGRIIVVTNSFASLDPRILTSDDNGETWQSSDVLKQLPGLDNSNAGESRIEMAQLLVSPTGRLIARGEDDEILTSDDEGDTWIVRLNKDFNLAGPFLDWEIRTLARVNGRWIATATYETPHPQNRTVQVCLTSDDDGATWREKPLVTQLESSVIQTLIPGENGRVIASGQNSTVITSDIDSLPAAVNPVVEVREGTTGQIPIERPPVDGAVELRYSGVQDTAIANTDYQPSGGFLNWADGEDDVKMVPLETIDNDIIDGERRLNMQLVFEEVDGFLGKIEIPVSITDDDGGTEAGLLFDGADHLYTSEAGDSVELLIALETEPTANVNIVVSGFDPAEGSLSQTSFVFTPGDWNRQQSLVITGVDDSHPDGDSSHDLRFAISSTDPDYDALPDLVISVVNLGDEAYQVGGEFLKASASAIGAPMITVKRKFTARRGKVKIKGGVSLNVVEVRVKAGRGGFKLARIKGNQFQFLAKRLPRGKKLRATILAINLDGKRVIKKVTIRSR